MPPRARIGFCIRSPRLWRRFEPPVRWRRFTPLDGETMYLVRACGLLTPSTVPGIGLGGLLPQPDSAVLGGLLLASTTFRDIRVHGPSMRIDALSAPAGIFVSRVFAVVGTGYNRLGRALRPTPFFTLVFAVLSGATPPTLPPRCPTPPSEASVALPPMGRISIRTRRRTGAAAGAAHFAVDYGFGPGRVPRTSPSRVDSLSCDPHPRLHLTASRATSRTLTTVMTVPITSNRARAELLGAPFLADISFDYPTARYSHAD